jgi:hypothetical protein
MQLSTIRAGLKTRLDVIDGLAVFAEAPGQVNPPVAVVAPSRDIFLVYDSQDSVSLTFVVTVLVSKEITDAAQLALDGYLDLSGASSVIAALQNTAVPLGGGADYATVAAVRGYGQIPYAGADYLGCEFVVAVAAS